GAGRPDEVRLDAAVALRRRNRDVTRLDPLVGLRDLLGEGVVGHQHVGDGAGREAGDGQLADAVEKLAAFDFTMNVEVIEFDGFLWQLGARLFHGPAPFGAEDITARIRLDAGRNSS